MISSPDPHPLLDAALDAIASAPAEDDPLPGIVRLVQALRPRERDGEESARSAFSRLLERLRGEDRLRRALADCLLRLFASRRQIAFYTDSGLLPGTGFFSELTRRLISRVLPEALDKDSLKDCVNRIFDRPKDHLWLHAIPPEDTLAFWLLLSAEIPPDHPAVRASREQMLHAVRILSHRLSAISVEAEIVRALPETESLDSPFVAQQDEARRFVEAQTSVLTHTAEATQSAEAAPMDELHLIALLAQCRALIDKARRAARREGASLDLTYTLLRMEQTADRLEQLATIAGAHLRPDPDHHALMSWAAFFPGAIHGENQRHGIRSFFSGLTSLLSLRITENASRAGEHYITSDRAGWVTMWKSATGAGLIVAAMALFKIFASRFELAPLTQALVYSADYAAGFIVILVLHFTLATKQPAMTAQTLAATLGEPGRKQRKLDRLADTVVDLIRSQIAAILGNVAAAIPMAILLALALSALFGHPLLGEEKAKHLLHDLSPWRSLALFHAAIAGFWLFAAGLISGLFDNLSAYDRIPERVLRMRWLERIIGPRRLARFSGYLEENLGGLVGNATFGVMLGSTALIGWLTGLPLDVRHVTFSSANFGYALAALDFRLHPLVWFETLLGLFLVGVVNLAVSFALALWVALLSRGVEFRHTRELVVLILQRLRARPRDFVVPPRETPATPTPAG